MSSIKLQALKAGVNLGQRHDSLSRQPATGDRAAQGADEKKFCDVLYLGAMADTVVILPLCRLG